MELAKIIIYSKTTIKQLEKPDSNKIYLDKFTHRAVTIQRSKTFKANVSSSKRIHTVTY